MARMIESCTEGSSVASRSNDPLHSVFSSATRTSSAVTRTRSPERLNDPSSTAATSSLAPASRALFPRSAADELRAFTLRPLTPFSALRSSSLMPSAR